MIIKKYICVVISLFFAVNTALAQDTIFLPSTLKKKEVLKKAKKKKKNRKKIAKLQQQKEIKKSVADSLDKKSFQKDTIAKSIPEIKVLEPNNDLLNDVKVDTDFSKPLQDNIVLEAFDENWKQELMNHGLFDTIQKTVTQQKYEKFIYEADLPTAVLKQRLVDLNAKTPFNVAYNPALESVIRNFLKNRHLSMERLMALSDYYFPLFEEVLDKYDLPLEIKYLAIVESALKPRAKSRVGATGLWQFMFGTGKMYGLNVSSYVDERMDPIKATEAAARYLAKLYQIFGDWDLALAAYNSGPGNVSKAIRRSGGYTNYWNIRPYLPRETAGYLPAFLATMYVFEFANKHDFKPKRVNFAYFETDTVTVKKQITLDQVAEVLNEKVETLQFLNPQYKLDIIPFIKEENYSLRLPYDKVGEFVLNEEAIYAKATEEFNKKEKVLPQFFEMDRVVKYRVRSGDYLGLIARKFGVRVSDLKRWNGLRNNNIRVGKYLKVYPRRIPKNGSNIVASKKKPNLSTTKGHYTVKSGDSLWGIASRFPGVSVENLKQWNNITSNQLKPGMRLKIKQ